MRIRTRSLIVATVAISAAALSACGASPGSGPGTPTTLAPFPACSSTSTSSGAGETVQNRSTSVEAPPATSAPDAPALDDAAISVASDLAATDATATGGTGQVAVVTVDDSGRPEITTAPAESAVDIATDLAADAGTDVVAIDEVVRVGVSATASTPPANDPNRSNQWGMSDMQIEDAWSFSTAADVDIAIIDSGITASHPEFSGRVCSGVAYLNNSPTGAEGAGAVDGNGHGTHVAGIAAAAANNGIGVVGVAPSARLMPVRVLGSDGNGFSSDVARGIIWAVDHGAEVINLSLGGSQSSDVTTAVNYATNSGVVVVAAAGNDGPSGPANYPAALPNSIAVGSYDGERDISWFSTHGSYVDVAAPGSDILSTATNGNYKWMSGTSMASPHVAGLAALMVAQQPSLSPAQVQAKIIGTAVDAGDTGVDTAFGHGAIAPIAALTP